MRHVGTHIIDGIESSFIDGEEITISDKLNIPLRQSIGGNTFGDLLIENDYIKFINSDNIKNALVDLSNEDLIKSLIVNEVTFDNFFNFGKDKELSESFHNDIVGDDLVTHQISGTYDTTIYNDSTNTPILEILVGDTSEALALYNKLNKFSTVGFPVKSRFYDSTVGGYDRTLMQFYDNIFYNSENKSVEVQLDTTGYLFLDSTENDIVFVDIDTYNIKDLITLKEYIDLPPHQHELVDLADLEENTNTLQGYTKLVNGSLKIDDDWTLYLKRSRINETIFKKNWIDDIIASRIFKGNINELSFDDVVNYDETEIILEDSTIQEYDYINLIITMSEAVKLSTVSNWFIEQQYDSTIVDTTTHETKYLVEILNFKYDNILLGEDQTAIIDQILDLRYEWIDKTSIDTLTKIYDIDIGDSTINIYNGYYDIDIIQPNQNTVPTSSIIYNNLYRDDDGVIHITRPDVYVDVEGDKHISVSRDSDVYFEYDSTVSLDLDIYILNDILNEQDYVDTITNADQLKRISLNRGRYKIDASTVLNKYTIMLFNRNN